MANRKNYPGHIRTRGDAFTITLSVDGDYHYFTLRIEDLEKECDEGETPRERAEAFARDKYNELQRRVGSGLPGPEPVSSLLDRFEEVEVPKKAPNTRRSYRQSLAAFRTYFVGNSGDALAHKVRPGHVEGFLDWRRTHAPDGRKRKKPLSARTVAKDRTVLHAVFEYGTRLEIVDSNPVAKTNPPKSDGRDPVILGPADYEALLASCEDNPMLHTYVLVLGETGMRCESEALWLRWSDLDMEAGFIRIEGARKGRRTKSGKARDVPMTPRLREGLREHMAAFRMKVYGDPPQRSPWVFHHPWSRRRAKAGERIGSLRRGFEAAVERARKSLDDPESSDLSGELNQHDLRHRRVTTWLAEGKPAHLVQKAMGHSDLRTTLHYEHLVRDDLRQLVEEPEREQLKELAR